MNIAAMMNIAIESDIPPAGQENEPIANVSFGVTQP